MNAKFHTDAVDAIHAAEGTGTPVQITAFAIYEQVRLDMHVTPTTVTLHTNGAGYNYVKFVLELEEDPTLAVEEWHVSLRERVRP